MAATLEQLDKEVQHWKAQLFAPATKSTYASHLRIYTKFCASIKVPPVPASSDTLQRYAAFLARTRTSATVQQYFNIIRIIHLECGRPNPIADNWQVRSLLQGIKRGKGGSAKSKEPVLPQHLRELRTKLDMGAVRDCQLWAATLTAFFGLLRVSNIAVIKFNSHVILRRDIDIAKTGITVSVTSSKNNQYGERQHVVVLPYIKGHPLCPTTAVLAFLAKTGSVPRDAPLFAVPQGRRYKPLTAPDFRRRFVTAMASVATPHGNVNSHSLRRGGATWLLTSGTPLASVRIMGDWRSDAIYRYLQPDVQARFDIINRATRSLPL